MYLFGFNPFYSQRLSFPCFSVFKPVCTTMIFDSTSFSVSLSILHWRVQNWPKDSRRDLIRAVDLLATYFLMQARIFLSYPFNKDTLLVRAQLGIHEEPKGLFCEAAFQPVSPRHVGAWGYSLSGKNFQFHFSELHEIPVNPFSQRAEILSGVQCDSLMPQVLLSVFC